MFYILFKIQEAFFVLNLFGFAFYKGPRIIEIFEFFVKLFFEGRFFAEFFKRVQDC